MKLQPKALLVLWALARQPNEVIPKRALLDVGWPRIAVSDDALTFQINAIRQALGDDARSPRYLATVHRVGFRFIAAVARADDRGSAPDALRPAGRERELRALHAELARAATGRRRIVFVTGEAGAGKTTLVACFQREVARDARVAAGRCADAAAAPTPYLSIVEALAQLGRDDPEGHVLDVLRRDAPSWLALVPVEASGDAATAQAQALIGASTERLARELSDALAALAAERPLVLVLEDLHWSGRATMTLLSALALAPEPARLAIVVTYRDTDAAAASHGVAALKVDLVARGVASELALPRLGAAAVAAYVDARLPGARGAAELVYRRSEGHALFMVQMTDWLAARGAGHVDALPPSLLDVIALQLDALTPDEQHVLECAAIAGAEFAAIDAADGTSEAAVEATCDRLAHEGRFLAAHGLAIWPDGTVSARYAFRHALYLDVLRRRTAPERRAELHRKVGLRKEAAYGERAHEIANDLADHFGEAGVPLKEMRWRAAAARRAKSAAATAEARAHAERGIERVAQAAPGPERDQLELELELVLVNVIDAERGYGSDEARPHVGRIEALLLGADIEPVTLAMAHSVTHGNHLLQGRLAHTVALADAVLARLGPSAPPATQAQMLVAGAYALFWSGELARSRERLERARPLAGPIERLDASLMPFTDVFVACHITLVPTTWAQGFPDTAARHARSALARAFASGNGHMIGASATYATGLQLYLRDPEGVVRAADRAVDACTRFGEPAWSGFAQKQKMSIPGAHASAEQCLAVVRGAIAAQRRMGRVLMLSQDLATEADLCRALGRLDEADAAIDAGLAAGAAHDAPIWQPELERIRGDVARARGHARAAEVAYRHALGRAEAHGARSLELRAATSLAELLREERRDAEAHALLAPITAWFTEGHATPDHRAATALLATLSGA